MDIDVVMRDIKKFTALFNKKVPEEVVVTLVSKNKVFWLKDKTSRTTGVVYSVTIPFK